MYCDGRKAVPDPVGLGMIEQWRAERGYVKRVVSDEEIVKHCVDALAAEGRLLLEEGVAQRMTTSTWSGYGFPREQGGPMFYAKEVGWNK